MDTVTRVRHSGAVAILLALVLTMVLPMQAASADDRSKAKRIHDRIAGVPPSEAVLQQMEDLVVANDPVAAALIATENPSFYNVTLKNFAAPWTNRDQSVFVPLNDYIATVIGMVRDGRDFRQILYGDVLYVGNVSPPYSTTSNAHYEALEATNANLGDDTVLIATTQSAVTGLPAAATAGVLTTRAAAQAFFIDGTNRAMFRFTLMNHLCRDLEQVHDTTRPPDRIRQDVSRSPGGDSRVFLNNCIGCHSGMDPMAQAFAYYDFNNDADDSGATGFLEYNSAGEIDPVTGTRVDAKYFNNNTTFEPGYITLDDQWDNYWRSGPNANLGWDPALPGAGAGAKSLGRELAHSDAFAQCQVEKVFRNVCLRSPADSDDRAQIDGMVTSFESNGYKLKQVFAESAAYCMGQ